MFKSNMLHTTNLVRGPRLKQRSSVVCKTRFNPQLLATFCMLMIVGRNIQHLRLTVVLRALHLKFFKVQGLPLSTQMIHPWVEIFFTWMSTRGSNCIFFPPNFSTLSPSVTIGLTVLCFKNRSPSDGLAHSCFYYVWGLGGLGCSVLA